MHMLIKLFIIFVSIFSAMEVSADKININKEIDLYALSQKYTRCSNMNYRDECYDSSRGKGYSMEGYWRQNQLWDGVYRNTKLNEITFKFFDGTRVYVGPGCSKNLQGWYVCKSGNKFKPVNGGTLDKDGNRQGEFIFKWTSGNVYEGNYKNNKKHGYGKNTWANGDVYEGNFENGNQHGYGKVTWSSGTVYEGNWEKGTRHGYGKYTWANGDVYEGNFENGTQHGYGKMTWADGQTYQGEFRKGEMVD